MNKGDVTKAHERISQIAAILGEVWTEGNVAGFTEGLKRGLAMPKPRKKRKTISINKPAKRKRKRK